LRGSFDSQTCQRRTLLRRKPLDGALLGEHFAALVSLRCDGTGSHKETMRSILPHHRSRETRCRVGEAASSASNCLTSTGISSRSPVSASVGSAKERGDEAAGSTVPPPPHVDESDADCLLGIARRHRAEVQMIHRVEGDCRAAFFAARLRLRRSVSAGDWGVSDPRCMPSDFAPKPRREGRSRPNCLPARKSGAAYVHRLRPRFPRVA
jgi:hypothetical protein